MLTIHVWPKRPKEFLLTHPLYKSPRLVIAHDAGESTPTKGRGRGQRRRQDARGETPSARRQEAEEAGMERFRRQVRLQRELPLSWMATPPEPLHVHAPRPHLASRAYCERSRLLALHSPQPYLAPNPYSTVTTSSEISAHLSVVGGLSLAFASPTLSLSTVSDEPEKSRISQFK